MVLIHVFARGNGLLFWKSIPGLGENPRGGSDEIPVAKIKISSSEISRVSLTPSYWFGFCAATSMLPPQPKKSY